MTSTLLNLNCFIYLSFLLARKGKIFYSLGSTTDKTKNEEFGTRRPWRRGQDYLGDGWVQQCGWSGCQGISPMNEFFEFAALKRCCRCAPPSVIGLEKYLEPVQRLLG